MVKKKSGGMDKEFVLQLVIIGIFALLLAFNLGRLYGSSGEVQPGSIGTVSASEIIPQGVPAVYGAEMGVSCDDVSPSNPRLADSTISKLRTYEDMELNREQMARYIKIGSEISCEYCCGAKAVIFSNGERACGCAHSYAMRGVAKYLLVNHPDMSDDEILSEMGKWKVLFFPGIMEKKAQILEDKGIDSKDYINLASNKYRGIEKGASSSGGMVGGC